MAIFRIQARWTGFTGAPGYSAFHFDAATEGAGPTAQACADAVGAFFVSVRDHLPSGVRVSVEAEVQRLEETTGELIGFETITAPAPALGNSAGNWSAASGAVVIWSTGGVRSGRRIQGRTFLVPLGGTGLSTDGTLSAAAQSTIQTAATTLADSITALHIWARPTAPGAADGQIASVTSARVPDMSAVLRSRRD